MVDERNIIVSRHVGAIRWLKEKKDLENSEVAEHFSAEDIRDLTRGDKVYGTLPMPMVAEVLEREAEFFLIVLPGVAFSQRGNELSPDEMEKAGAKLLRVNAIELKEVRMNDA